MQEYQERVIQEQKDLDEKILKLDAFLQRPNFYQRVPDSVERSLLRAQFGAMKEYSRLLGERIRCFSGLEGDGG